jgi:hypothetical protein
MEIYINEKPINVEASNLLTFAQLLQKIETDLLQPVGEVLTHIQLNDRDLDESAEADNQGLPIARVQSLKLRTATPQSLILEGLQDAPDILSEVHKILGEVLKAFSQSNDSKGYQEFVVVTDGLSWFNTIYTNALALFQETILKNNLQQSVFVQESQKLSDILNQILECQNSGDRTTLVDLLEYELQPVLKCLAEEVESFRETLISGARG